MYFLIKYIFTFLKSKTKKKEKKLRFGLIKIFMSHMETG